MKRKNFIALVAASFALTGIVVAGAVALANHGVFAPYLVKATPKESGSYTLTATNFKNGNGDINVGDGIVWHFDNATVSGDVVTIKSVMYTSSRSGSTKSGSRRGDGYTRLTIADADLSKFTGVFHLQDVNGVGKKNDNALSADVDLTFGGTVPSENRRGIYFAQGGESEFSFTSMTFYYDCTAVNPTIDITAESLSVSVGETGNLEAKKTDTFVGDVVSFSWDTADHSIATVVGNGLNATVTGVDAGNTTVTVTMTVNGDDFTDTIPVTVNAVASTVKDLGILDTSRVDGASLFCLFNPSSQGITKDDIDSFGLTNRTLTFESGSYDTAINNVNLQDKGNDSYTVYVALNKADGLNTQVTFKAEFKDTTNNIIYRATWHFDGGKLCKEVNLASAAKMVEVGNDLAITASKGYFLDGEPSFSFSTDDPLEEVASLSVSDNVATLTGVAAGNIEVTVDMLVGGVHYYSSVVIEVIGGITEVPLTITSASWGGAGCHFYTDVTPFTSHAATFTDCEVTITVTGASFNWNGVGNGSCWQGDNLYLVFTGAPANADVYTVNASFQYGSTAYTFSVSFHGTTMD